MGWDTKFTHFSSRPLNTYNMCYFLSTKDSNTKNNPGLIVANESTITDETTM